MEASSWDADYAPDTVVWCLRHLICQDPLSVEPLGVVCGVFKGTAAMGYDELKDRTRTVTKMEARSVQWNVCEWHEQGYRPSMEDASFHVEFQTKSGKYLLCGVADGHGGEVSIKWNASCCGCGCGACGCSWGCGCGCGGCCWGWGCGCGCGCGWVVVVVVVGLWLVVYFFF